MSDAEKPIDTKGLHFSSLPLSKIRTISEQHRQESTGALYPDVDRGNSNVIRLSDAHYIALAGMSGRRQFYAEQLAWRDALINEQKERIQVLEEEAATLRAQIDDTASLGTTKVWESVLSEKTDKKSKPDPKKPTPPSESSSIATTQVAATINTGESTQPIGSDDTGSGSGVRGNDSGVTESAT